VIGRDLFSFNSSLKNGIMLPFVHITFQALTQTNLVSVGFLFAWIISLSQTDLQDPYTFIGLHALSVETSITIFTH
jgi:hypothetical protein